MISVHCGKCGLRLGRVMRDDFSDLGEVADWGPWRWEHGGGTRAADDGPMARTSLTCPVCSKPGRPVRWKRPDDDVLDRAWEARMLKLPLRNRRE